MAEPSEFVLIIGAMKSGTTSLFELMSQHPEIAGCSVKEPDFFAAGEFSNAGWKEYTRLWDWDPVRHKVALEASTSYAKAPWVAGVPELISVVPGARFRFIYVMRDPIARIASQVRHSLYEGWGKTLDEALGDDLVDFSRYAMQIDEYLRHFLRDSMLLLTLEELRFDPDAVLSRVCGFLGVASDWRFAGQKHARNKGDFYQVPPWVRRLAKNPLMRSVVGALPPGTHRRLRETVGRLGSGRDDQLGRWQLNQQERQEVWALLRGDLVRLRDVYGVDIDRFWPIPQSILTS